MPDRPAQPSSPPAAGPTRAPSASGSNGSNGSASSNGSNGSSRGGVSDDTVVRPTSTDTRPTPVIPPPPASPTPSGRSKPSRAEAKAARDAQKAEEKRTGAPEVAAVPAVTRSSDSTADGTSTASRPRATRRARLRLTRLDPWSVMKTAFLLSIAFGVVTVVSVAVVWQVLGAAGVWDSINATIQETIGGPDTSGFDVQDYVGTSRVLGFTMLVAAVDVVLLTAVATLGAFLYNMAAALLGGIEVTLAEDPR